MRCHLLGVMLLPLILPNVARSQQLERISVNSAGVPADLGSSQSVISADGRIVVFVSNARNLVAGDSNFVDDVFLRDTQAGTTIRLSVSASGAESPFSSGRPGMSSDGTLIAFDSAGRFVSEDTNEVEDIYVRDVVNGTIVRASVSSSGTQGNLPSLNPSISANRRFVAFSSLASNLVPNDTNGAFDIFVRDLETQTTTRVNVSASGVQANDSNGNIGKPALSADGRFVAFESPASNLVDNDTNGMADIFLHDRQTGQTRRVSVASDGSQAEVTGQFAGTRVGSGFPSMSADGRFIAFTSVATNLVPGDTNDEPDVFVHDTQTGTTTRVGTNSQGGQSPQGSFQAVISADGTHVAFVSPGELIGKEEDVQERDVFLRNLTTGELRRVSARDGKDTRHAAEAPSVSSDGRFVSFSADASFIPGGGNSGTDIFRYERTQGATGSAKLKGAFSTVNGKRKLKCTLTIGGKKAAGQRVNGQVSPTGDGVFTNFGGAKTTKQGVALIALKKSTNGKFVRCEFGGAITAPKKVRKPKR